MGPSYFQKTHDVKINVIWQEFPNLAIINQLYINQPIRSGVGKSLLTYMDLSGLRYAVHLVIQASG